MQIGELDRRVTIENYSASTNTYGEQIESWSTYRTVWAKIDFNGGNVKDEFEKLTGIAKVVFFVRNLDIANLTTKSRINYDSKTYYVQAVNEIEGREKFLELITEQRD